MSAFEVILNQNNPDGLIRDDADFLTDSDFFGFRRRTPPRKPPFILRRRSGFDGEVDVDFLGLGKKGQEKREQRKKEHQEKRKQRQEFKLKKIETKAAGKAAVQTAKGATGMENLFNNPDALAALGAPGGGSAMGPVQQAPLAVSTGPGLMSSATTFWENNKRMIMIVGAVIVAVILVVVYLKYFRKKK